MKCSGFIGGILSGLALGILFAPEKGTVTRTKIKESANDLKDQIEQLFGIKKDEFDKIYDALENKAEDISDDMRDKLITLLDKAKTAIK